MPVDAVHPGLPVTDLFDATPLIDHADFRTKVVLRPMENRSGDAPVRSWFGGMPQMPAAEPWPSGPSGKMVFVAQIFCGDLPRRLWGGIGPRKGWLLVFLDALPVGGEPYSRILHITEDGPARHEGSDVDITFTRSGSPLSAPALPHVPVELVEARQGKIGEAALPHWHTMGGLPVQGWHEPNHMNTSAYAPPALRYKWSQEFPYLGIEPASDQELLLFELASDDRMGWLWGEVDHAVIRMPRGDLVQKRFDRAVLEMNAG